MDTFETHYDALGHELHIGDSVLFKIADKYLIGSISKFTHNKKGQLRYMIVPSPLYKTIDGYEELKRSYKISDRNVYLVYIHRKEN